MCCGQQQSPIDLSGAFHASAPAGYLSLHWTKSVDGYLKDGKCGVEVVLSDAAGQYLMLGEKKFYLKGMHFHRPNEHKLCNQTFDAELHIVHRNPYDLSYAVIGIFLKVDPLLKDGQEGNAMMEAFADARGVKACLPSPVWWLPDNRDRILRYEGSLTTSPYSEDVSWAVFPAPKRISGILMEAIFGGSHPHSARDIQPLNRRFVLDMAINPKTAK